MRCVALLSSGLDSQLAVCLMLQQGIEVEAVHVRTPFTDGQDRVRQVAQQLAVPLTVVDRTDEYLDIVRSPRFGRGGGMNPCIDCRIYMVRRAFAFMNEIKARFMVSGEVVGQRPMSQKRRDLETIAHHGGCFDLLLRPLSATNLPPTRPEREGWVDRSKLHGFSGRGRRPLIELARSLGLETIPSPSSGCLLTDKHFSYKVSDLLRHQPSHGAWDFELLKHGRHFRYDDGVKVVLGRREEENTLLEYLHALPDATSSGLVKPDDFRGPAGLIVGPISEGSLRFACGLLLRYAKRNTASGGRVCVSLPGGLRYVNAGPDDAARQAVVLAKR
ncbi:MAG: tRNA 4-thiouridine(8) synthase ThiI [Planctomycetota bacterium]